jgi:hypothetical protein
LKNSWLNVVGLARDASAVEPPDSSTARHYMTLWKTVFSMKCFQKTADQRVEISILLSEFLHLSNRVNNRGMVFSTEAPPDLGK